MDARIPVEELLQHQSWVRALARSLVLDESRADDVAQETWISAMRNPPRREGGGVRAWLAAVVRNHARKGTRGERRRDARHAAAPPRPEGEPPDETIARVEMHRKVVDAVLALEDPYRRVLVLRYFDGLAPTEIAARLGVPVDTVKTQQKRGLARIREAFDADSGGRDAWCAALAPLAGLRVAPPPVVPVPPVATTAAATGSAWAVTALVAAALGVVGVVIFAGGAPAPGPIVAAAPRPPAPRPPRARPQEPLSSDEAAPAPDDAADDPPAQPPAAAPVPAPTPEPANNLVLAVRDLADGSWVPGLKLTAHGKDGKTLDLASDGSGSLSIDAALLPTLALRDSAWRLATYDAGELEASPTLWVWRSVAVQGVVEDPDEDDPVNLADVVLTVTCPGGLGQRDAAPWDNFWLRRHGVIERQSMATRPDVDGRFFARVPALRGVRIAASVARRRSADIEVPLSKAAGDPAPVRLVLGMPLFVRGRVVGPDGAVIGGWDAQVELRIRDADEPAATSWMLRNGGGMVGGAEGWQMIFRLQIDPDGGFEQELPLEGDAWLVILPPEPYAAVVEHLGPPLKDAAVTSVAVQERRDARVRIVRGAAPVASRTIAFFDKTPGGPHSYIPLATDESGTADARWLLPGRSYAAADGKESRVFTWTGQTTLDLDALGK